MADQIKFGIGLQDISAYDESGYIYDRIYDGTIDLLARTKCVARCVNLNVQANVDTYLLDHSLLALVDVENGQRRARRDETFVPSFTLIRADVLRLDPAPSADGSVQTWAVIRPAQMAGDSDSPGMEQYGGIPSEYHDAIVLYGLWKAADYADDASAQQGERYRALYEGPDGRAGRIAQIRSLVNRRGSARAPRRRVTLSAQTSRDAWVG
jgi:hypothetical protein